MCEIDITGNVDRIWIGRILGIGFTSKHHQTLFGPKTFNHDDRRENGFD